MKITALVENTTQKNLQTEHGLSLYIETEKYGTILFDTGQGDLFERNAGILGVDLKAVDRMILSHGHYDHGGGLLRFMECNDHAPVYITETAFGQYYGGRGNYIGLDPRIRLVPAHQDRLIFTDGDVRLEEGMTILAPAGREKVIDMGSAGLLMKKNGQIVPDEFLHEQYLMIEENGKRILFSGCSHQGILNIMHWFRPDVMIGGFHFMDMLLDEQLADYASQLGHYPSAYYTCHCTGVEQYHFIKPYIKNLQYLSEGMTLVI